MTSLSNRAPTGLAGRHASIVELPAVVPVIAAPSPRVLWAALDGEVGLALWFRVPAPPLARQVEALLRQPPFELAAKGTPTELEAETRGRLPPGGAAGPLVTDIAILAALFSRLAGCSALQMELRCDRAAAGTDLRVGEAPLTLLCCYGGPGIEWQDAAGTVRRMPPSHVGLFKGRGWPDDAMRTPFRLPPAPPSQGRLMLSLRGIAYA